MFRPTHTLAALLLSLSFSAAIHAGEADFPPPAPLPVIPSVPVVAGDYAANLGKLRIEQTGETIRLTWPTADGTSVLDGKYQTVRMANVRNEPEDITGFFGNFTFTSRDGQATKNGAGIIMPALDGSGAIMVRSQECVAGQWYVPAEVRLELVPNLPPQPAAVPPRDPAPPSGPGNDADGFE